MKVEAAKIMSLGDKLSLSQAGHRYITLELEFNVDMAAIALNLVPSCDWTSNDLLTSINGRHMEFDMSQVIQAGGMASLQSVYIDNGPNSCAFTLEVSSTKHRVTCPPASQGWFPLICARKDGRFKLGATDKGAQVANSVPSWYSPASAAGTGVNVIYKPTFHFTDLAVPPCVWDVRQKCSTIISLLHTFSTAGLEALTTGSVNRRMGLSFRALEDNFGMIQLGKGDVRTLTITQNMWHLLPGEVLRFEGESCPTDAFYAAAAFATDAVEILLQI